MIGKTIHKNQKYENPSQIREKLKNQKIKKQRQKELSLNKKQKKIQE